MTFLKRYGYFFCLMLVSGVLHAQSTASLKTVDPLAAPLQGRAIMYGQFIQRLGFSSGGFPQYITLWNIDSAAAYRFRVKETFKSAKKNTFCRYIPAGRYAIMQYEWTESKWYGGEAFIEPILKDTSRRDYIDNRWQFVIAPGSITYAGTWNFAETTVHFSDEKETLQSKMRKTYKKLNVDTAITHLPQ